MRGTLFLLDGASCSGKSTLVDRLTADPTLPIDLIPRCSTRERRPDDQPRREYLFVSRDAFVDLARAGGFIEYRDFQFGMSYGLPWAEAFAPLLDGPARAGGHQPRQRALREGAAAGGGHDPGRCAARDHPPAA